MLVVVILTILSVAVAEEKYTSKYDKVDIKSIAENHRLLTNYFNCLMDKGKCTPDGAELKKNLPDALETDCSKCSEKQKELSNKWVKFFSENKKEMFDQLVEKYDPEGKYKKRYEGEDGVIKV